MDAEMTEKTAIEIYQGFDGQTQIEVRLEDETIWLSQVQMAELFDKDVRTINEHLKTIFKEDELKETSTIRKFRIVRKEGKRSVKREIAHYNLDAVISVGYRVNSKQGTQFRIWATQRLKEYLIQGYSLNMQRFEQNASELEQALQLIEKAAGSPAFNADCGRGLLEITKRYTQTFLWLQRYDEGLLEEPKGQKGGILPSLEDAEKGLCELKRQLMERGEATELFSSLKSKDGLAAIFGNLEQTVFGEPAYSTTGDGHLSKVAPGIYPPLFTNFSYDNLGIPVNATARALSGLSMLPYYQDLGLGAQTAIMACAYGGKYENDGSNDGKFKVPSLRGVAKSAPYGHNVFFPTLTDVVNFYYSRTGTPEVQENVNNSELGNLGMDPAAVNAIVAFLNTLTDQ